jgi:hypothetical protein
VGAVLLTPSRLAEVVFLWATIKFILIRQGVHADKVGLDQATAIIV